MVDLSPHLGVRILVCMLIISFIPSALAQQNISSEVTNAKQQIMNCYEITIKAEVSGANISALTDSLNEALFSLSKAESAIQNGNFIQADIRIKDTLTLIEQINQQATQLLANAVQKNNDEFIFKTILPIIAVALVFFVSLTLWKFSRKKSLHSNVNRFNLTQYKTLYIILTALLALFFVSPVLEQILVYPQTEYFTEYSILGSEHSAYLYPNEIEANTPYKVFLTIANHLGSSTIYQIRTKFVTPTDQVPENKSYRFNSFPSLNEIDLIVPNQESTELPITFRMNYAPLGNGVVFSELMLNDYSLNIDNRYVETNGVFDGNLVFELWIYNQTTLNYQFHLRYLDLKFNVTSTPRN